jgi:hypothetical protein
MMTAAMMTAVTMIATITETLTFTHV